MAILLTILAVLFVYPFVIYPLLLRMVAGPACPTAPPDAADALLPAATLVVCALNEGGIIRDKVENSLALDYPAGKLRRVFISDGSTDRTAEIIGEYGGRGIELIDRPVRRGKVVNLNEVIPSLDTEIVILSDANVIYDAAAARRLAARLISGPAIGCVSGRVILTGTTDEFRSSEESYYSLEWKLQQQSSDVYSMTGADGAMYAFRRELFVPCPNDTIIEDFVIPMTIVRGGRRVVFEPSAVGWEAGPQSLGEEYRRKVRIAAGAAQSVKRGNGLPGAAPLRFWWIYLSHKFLRWSSPFAGLAAVAVAAASPSHWLSQLILAGLAAGAVGAALGWATGLRNSILRGLFYFLFAETAIFVGVIRGLLGLQRVTWAKANR